MSDTPRVDALLDELRRIGAGAKDYRIDMEALARRLERELNDAILAVRHRKAKGNG